MLKRSSKLEILTTIMCGNVLITESPDENSKYSESLKIQNKRTLLFFRIGDNNLMCTIIAPNSRDGLGATGVKPIPSQKKIIEEISTNLDIFFKEVTPVGDPKPEKWKSFLINLRSQSKRLFKSIIPDDIAYHINRWEDGCWVEIITDEHWIPWELLHDNKRFWGERFILTRHVYSKDRADRETEEYKNSKRILNIVGGALNREKENAKKFFGNFSLPVGVEVSLLEEYPLSSFLDNWVRNDAGIVHFTCHGLTKPMCLQINGLSEFSTNLGIATVQEELALSTNCLVFANACNSTRNIRLFDESISFGQAFCQKGANVFIGTLGPIPTAYAIEFARDVYSEIFPNNKEDEQHYNVGYALAFAKQKALDKHNLFWLLYCMYGDGKYSVNLWS